LNLVFEMPTAVEIRRKIVDALDSLEDLSDFDCLTIHDDPDFNLCP